MGAKTKVLRLSFWSVYFCVLFSPLYRLQHMEKTLKQVFCMCAPMHPHAYPHSGCLHPSVQEFGLTQDDLTSSFLSLKFDFSFSNWQISFFLLLQVLVWGDADKLTKLGQVASELQPSPVGFPSLFCNFSLRSILHNILGRWHGQFVEIFPLGHSLPS